MLKVWLENLLDVSVRLVKAQKKSLVQDEATAKANEKLVKLLVPSMKRKRQTNNPLESLFGGAIPNFGQNNEKLRRTTSLRKLEKQNVLKLRDS